MDSAPLPEQFKILARLADGPASLAQAAALTRALEDVPALQRWLKSQRGRVVAELREADHSREEIARYIGCGPQRVSDIVQGHSRQAGPRRAVRLDE